MRFRDGRRSLCLSSQSGCPLTCTFCATGAMRFGRNLTASEILDQALHFRRIEPVNHAVFMGMGEPLMNFDAVIAACEPAPRPRHHASPTRRSRPWAGSRVSSRFVGEGTRVRLALSLHAADPALRSELMPVNDRYPLAEVLDACRAWRAAPATGLHRVPDARRGQRLPEHARLLAEVLGPRGVQGQPDPLQPDRAASTARARRRSTPSKRCSSRAASRPPCGSRAGATSKRRAANLRFPAA